MGLKSQMVRLDEYNPDWEREFNIEKDNLKHIFGNIIKSIEHIGSTAIKGLSAKPIIDIAVGVEKLKDFELVKDKFNTNRNYLIKEDSTPGEILIIRESGDITTHLIHVMEIESERYTNTILFRNYLRTHSNTTKEYQELKEKLALKHHNNRPEYTKSKSHYINNIICKAREELNAKKEEV